MRYDFSIIIPYYSNKFNNIYINSHIEELKKNPKCEIIIVESGRSPSNIKKISGLKYIYAYSDSNKFNLSWLYNMGIYNTTTNDIFITDFRYNQSISLYNDIFAKYGSTNEVNAIMLSSKILKIDRSVAISKDVNVDRENLINIQTSGSMGHVYYKKGYLTHIGGYDENVLDIDNIHRIQTFKMENIGKVGKSTNMETYFYDLIVPDITPLSKEKYDKYTDKILSNKEKLMSYINGNVRYVGHTSKYNSDRDIITEKMIIN